MTMASRVPVTTRSRVDSSWIWDIVGLTTNWPSMSPMRTEPTGPPNGISEIVSAAEAPSVASTSCAFSRSTENVVATTCTSFMKPLGNSGRMGRSIWRAARIAFSLGRDSRLMNPPGILPAA